MEKRFFLALLLTGAVMMVTQFIFPRPTTPVPAVSVDSAGSVAPSAVAQAPQAAGATQTPTIAATPIPGAAASAAAPAAAETLTVRTDVSQLSFSTLGAAPFAVQEDSFKAMNGKNGQVVLRHGLEPLLRYRVIAAGDTIALDRTAFTATKGTATDGSETVTFTGTSGKSRVTVNYRFSRSDYVTTASIDVSDAGTPAFLLVELPRSLDTQEADTTGDHRQLAYAVKPQARGAKGTTFASLDPGQVKLEPGPLTWAVAKSKYFLVGLLAPVGGTPFAEARFEGGARTQKIATIARGTVVMPLDARGHAAFEIYAGPQSWERLHRLGRDFETANPYGGFLQGIVQPFATMVVRVLLWMKRQVHLDYGWVLVIFGVVIRLLLWPLNQGAMRTSIKMQRIQPELMDVQKRYKSDPQKQQQEIMRVYREHGMSPFSAFSGCLPMLIPMPVFFALFFVFQNTIEFRGVPFLWLHDISLPDPFYILPVVMGASMFLLSWIGMRNAPPNPQAKMMLYMMPAMFVFILFNTAAGLSVYYLTQNIASLPQQWLIANERAKATKAITPA